MAQLRQPWEGPGQGGCSSGVLDLGSHLSLCIPVLLWACADRWADSPCDGLGVAQQGITWTPPAAVFLSSLVGVEMHFIT